MRTINYNGRDFLKGNELYFELFPFLNDKGLAKTVSLYILIICLKPSS